METVSEWNYTDRQEWNFLYYNYNDSTTNVKALKKTNIRNMSGNLRRPLYLISTFTTLLGLAVFVRLDRRLFSQIVKQANHDHSKTNNKYNN